MSVRIREKDLKLTGEFGIELGNCNLHQVCLDVQETPAW
jgi:hypothetical protein